MYLLVYQPKVKVLDISGNPFGMFSCLTAEGVLDLKQYPSLETLKAKHIRVTSFLNAPFHTLRRLDCSYGMVEHLDNLPEGLISLCCDFNRIKSLDCLPSSLEFLSCIKNQIETLNKLPKALEELQCGANPLRDLDHLPFGLKGLKCDGIDIPYLDNLPRTLTHLICRDSKVKDMLFLPPFVKTLLFEGKEKELFYWKKVAEIVAINKLDRDHCFVSEKWVKLTLKDGKKIKIKMFKKMIEID
jgi:Leucine-rich repeat (LRR) protein